MTCASLLWTCLTLSPYSSPCISGWDFYFLLWSRRRFTPGHHGLHPLYTGDGWGELNCSRAPWRWSPIQMPTRRKTLNHSLIQEITHSINYSFKKGAQYGDTLNGTNQPDSVCKTKGILALRYRGKDSQHQASSIASTLTVIVSTYHGCCVYSYKTRRIFVGLLYRWRLHLSILVRNSFPLRSCKTILAVRLFWMSEMMVISWLKPRAHCGVQSQVHKSSAHAATWAARHIRHIPLKYNISYSSAAQRERSTSMWMKMKRRQTLTFILLYRIKRHMQISTFSWIGIFYW